MPIIEDPERYDLAFRDHANCIIASPNGWAEAVQKALNLPENEVLRMRRNVLALREDRLLPEKAISHFNSQLLG